MKSPKEFIMEKLFFINKSHLGKVSRGDKFIIYESWSSKCYTGWADIKLIGKQKTNTIIQKYGKKMMITKQNSITILNIMKK